jgi:hypothetical protein
MAELEEMLSQLGDRSQVRHQRVGKGRGSKGGWDTGSRLQEDALDA